MHEGRKQTNTWRAYAGSRLELCNALGRRRLKCHPSSRTGEKPAVRNDRGDRGDVGIIRSPVRASILPDCGGCPVMGIPTAILDPFRFSVWVQVWRVVFAIGIKAYLDRSLDRAAGRERNRAVVFEELDGKLGTAAD